MFGQKLAENSKVYGHAANCCLPLDCRSDHYWIMWKLRIPLTYGILL